MKFGESTGYKVGRLDGISAGVAASASIGLILIFSINFPPKGDGLATIEGAVIAALGALLAAAVTVSIINKQIKQQYEFAWEANLRNNLVARAEMLSELSLIDQYLRDIVAQSVQLVNPNNGILIQSGLHHLPAHVASLPRPKTVHVLECIRSADDCTTGQILRFLSDYQILFARIDQHKAVTSGLLLLGINVNDIICHAIGCIARTGALFRYSRHEVSSVVTLTLDDLYNAAGLCHLWQSTHPFIWADLKRLFDAGEFS